MAARATFFAAHGWIASTNTMGTDDAIEFRIAHRLVSIPGIRLALLFAEDPARPAYWPDERTDATLDPNLIRGTPPDLLNFEPATWAEALRLRPR